MDIKLGFRKSDIVDLLIDDIQKNPYQNRTYFDEESISELAESIKIHGLLQPILVRKVNKEYFLVSGERRIRAAKVSGLKYIQAVVKNMNEAEAAAATLVENLQREDVSFLDEAAGYQKLNKDLGLSQNEIAKSVGKSQAYIANKIRLLNLPAAVREIISREINLTERHCRALLRLPDEDTQMRMLKEIIEKSMTTQQTDQKVEKYVSGIDNEKKYRRVMVIKDIRIFLNTIRSTIKTMQDSGVQTEWEEDETEEFYEYKIKVKK